MIRQSIYLDANASEPMRSSVISAMVDIMQQTGNPTSVHQMGRKIYNQTEDARETLVELFGGSVQNCIFTSGGTEADVLAVHGQIGEGNQQRPLWVGATEHPAIMQIDLSKKILPVTRQGIVDLNFLEDALKKTSIPPLVCLMLANNETGVLHPIQQAAKICHDYGAILHVDAAQAAGRIMFNLEDIGADSLILSAHKMGGPKGVGALLLAGHERNAKKINPLFSGGGQEQGRRGGTLAVPAIIGLMTAAKEACKEDRSNILKLRNYLEKEVKKYGAVICGEEAERLDNTSSIAYAGVSAQKLFMALDMAGFCVSTGSACFSGKLSRSPVLSAMGLEELADCTIRVSLPWNIQQKDVENFIHVYGQLIQKLKDS
ncbi:cysteine desulfurase family protein [Commensalibacter melissae]|uniref:cysteine desulfurase family protein n=1 Tax=Commensalibacter melissae TaxID=2070537 RepID=UPI0012D8602D|nr:aminotransferase class V-fold PLP-dependent enzyme [Commensalibacter melissae]MUG77197.1 aminotransferase class V-fold PLP-dependent enzyme [Commensalibacter melissae]